MPSTLALTLVIGLLAAAASSAAVGPRRPRLAVDIARAASALGLAGTIVLAIAARSTDQSAGGLLVLDGLGTTLSVFVLGMAVVVTSFASRSLAIHRHAERFFAAATALAGSTVVLVLANRPAVMALGWVMVSMSTVWLIGSDGRPASLRAARRAARAFIIGDVALLAATVLALVSTDGATSTVAVATAVGRRDGVGLLVAAGVVLGALARSAQVPFHGWLPASVDAPTPVSAMLHAGVVNGSAVLMLRWYPAVQASSVIVVLAVATGLTGILLGMAVGRTRADVKGGLAWTTVAQMGFMTIQCALGLVGPAVIHLIAHGMFKSSLFLGSGSALRSGSAHPHTAATHRRPIELIASGAGGGLAVAVALAVVRPVHLGSGVSVIPIAFTWATASYALWQWRAARTTSSTLLPIAIAACAATLTLGIAAGVESWIGIDWTSPSNQLQTVLAAVVVLTVFGAWLIGAVLPRLPAKWSDAAWMRVATLATPRSSVADTGDDRRPHATSLTLTRTHA